MNAPSNKDINSTQFAEAPVVAQPTARPASTEVATRQAEALDHTTVGFNSVASFALLQRASALLAASTLVPKDYQNNLPNCVIALNMAARLGADPLLVMQNLYLVHGKPGWSSQFLIATFNQSGRFTAMRFEFFGDKATDGWGCRAWANEKDTGDRLTGADVTIGIAKSEGWYNRQGSKWQTMPQQMLMYRAASWFVRTTAPELSMGLQTAEELGDVFEATRRGDGTFVVDAATGEIKPVEPKTPAEAVTAKLRAAAPVTSLVPPVSTAAATPEPMPMNGKLETLKGQALDSIRQAQNAEQIKQAWKSVRTNYINGDADIPLEVEAAYQERKEILAQPVQEDL